MYFLKLMIFDLFYFIKGYYIIEGEEIFLIGICKMWREVKSCRFGENFI